MTLPLLLKRSTHVFISMVQYNPVQLLIVEMSIHWYFKSEVNLPMPSQAQLSSNVLKTVNQAVTAVLECEELGNQASKVKNESTMCLSCLRVALLLEGVAFSLDSLQSLESQSGLYSAIRNCLTRHSKPILRYVHQMTVAHRVLSNCVCLLRIINTFTWKIYGKNWSVYLTATQGYNWGSGV